MVARKPKDENSILESIPVPSESNSALSDTPDLLGDANSGSVVESFESDGDESNGNDTDDDDSDDPDVEESDSESGTQNDQLNVFDPLAETVISDEFFAQLQPTDDQQSSETALKLKPPELPVDEQLKLYLSDFEFVKDEFVSGVYGSHSNITEGEFYNLIGELIFECFFNFPVVYDFLFEHHKNNKHYYSRVENRKGFLDDFLVSLGYQYELAVDALNDEMSQELSKAAHFEASAKQDSISEVLETLRN